MQVSADFGQVDSWQSHWPGLKFVSLPLDSLLAFKEKLEDFLHLLLLFFDLADVRANFAANLVVGYVGSVPLAAQRLYFFAGLFLAFGRFSGTRLLIGGSITPRTLKYRLITIFDVDPESHVSRKPPTGTPAL